MTVRPEVPEAIVARLRTLCLTLPEVREEQAWVGTRWCIRTKTFAHVVAIADGWPPAYAEAAGTNGPCTVLTFRAGEDDVEALRQVGPPFFKPVWFRDIVGMTLDGGTDWDEVAEVVTDSYCRLAPVGLAARVGRPSG